MGPTMPMQSIGGPPAIAPAVGAHVDIANVNDAMVASVTSGADGSYSVPLASGDYLVTVTPATRILGRIARRSVTVTPGAPTALDITLDTGIRWSQTIPRVGPLSASSLIQFSTTNYAGTSDTSI
jgi:hypothetical protein